MTDYMYLKKTAQARICHIGATTKQWLPIWQTLKSFWKIKSCN